MTNWFEQYYSELIDYASVVVFKRELQADPVDLVNDAYLKFFESEKEFDLQEVKTFISSFGFKEKHYQQSKTNFGDRFLSGAIHSHREDRVCNICNKLKCIGEYRVFKHIPGYIYVANYCFDCERAKHNKQFREWLARDDNRKKWNAYVSNWRRGKGKTGMTQEEWKRYRAANKKPISELVKKCFKAYYQREKEKLSDVYIRRILAPRTNITPEMIRQKREQLLEKRRLANSVIKNKAA